MVNMIVVVGATGDCFDRVQARLLEICVSSFLVVQFASCVCSTDSCPLYFSAVDSVLVYDLCCLGLHGSSLDMESVLIAFKQCSVSGVVNTGRGVSHAEVPKGELLVYLVCNTSGNLL